MNKMLQEQPPLDPGVQNIIDKIRKKILDNNPSLDEAAVEKELRRQAERLLKEAEGKEVKKKTKTGESQSKRSEMKGSKAASGRTSAYKGRVPPTEEDAGQSRYGERRDSFESDVTAGQSTARFKALGGRYGGEDDRVALREKRQDKQSFRSSTRSKPAHPSREINRPSSQVKKSIHQEATNDTLHDQQNTMSQITHSQHSSGGNSKGYQPDNDDSEDELPAFMKRSVNLDPNESSESDQDGVPGARPYGRLYQSNNAEMPSTSRPRDQRSVRRNDWSAQASMRSRKNKGIEAQYRSSQSAASHPTSAVGRVPQAASRPRPPPPSIPASRRAARFKAPWETSSEESDAADEERIDPNAVQATWGDESLGGNKYICNYPDCERHQPSYGFKTVKELRAHKYGEHDVCEKCNMDFDSWAALLAHKQMSPNHIACWSCAQDFETAPAREKHMLSYHPQMKNLHCPGCGSLYQDSPSFVRHITHNTCGGISPAQFNKAGLMFTKMNESVVLDRSQADAPEPKQVIDADNEEDFPGLPGLDLREPDQSQRKAMEKAKNYESPWKPLDTSTSATMELIKKLEKMSTKDVLSSVEVDEQQKRLLDVYRKMYGYDNQTPQLPMTTEGDVIWEAVPNQKLYNPGIFKEADNRFHCPFPYCKKSFDRENTLDKHIQSPKHQRREIRCPECCHKFFSHDSILAHLESPSVKCKIKHTELFKPAMEIASCSFLTASHDTFGKLTVETQEPDWSR